MPELITSPDSTSFYLYQAPINRRKWTHDQHRTTYSRNNILYRLSMDVRPNHPSTTCVHIHTNVRRSHFLPWCLGKFPKSISPKGGSHRHNFNLRPILTTWLGISSMITQRGTLPQIDTLLIKRILDKSRLRFNVSAKDEERSHNHHHNDRKIRFPWVTTLTFWNTISVVFFSIFLLAVILLYPRSHFSPR